MPAMLALLVATLICHCSALGLLARMGRVPAAVGQPGVPDCTLYWHMQSLDHFDYAERRQFRQRVFYYDAYWRRGAGPILFYTGNEANVELYVNATGLMWEHAKSLSALLVFAEHRYYGESLPLGSQSTANASTLRWLTMEQALADYADVIYSLKNSLNASDAPVVALGGSYGGMLAAWLRMHYPGSVCGAIAASAPVLAFDGMGRSGRWYASGQWVSNAYWQVVTADASVAKGSVAGCTDGVRATWAALAAKGESAVGRASLGRTFKLCAAPRDQSDVARLRAWLLNVWDTLAMGNFPYRSNYLVYQQTHDASVTLPPWPLRVACSSFAGARADEPADTLLQRMAASAGVLYNASGREPCFSLPSDPNYDGIWDYQWCTERQPQETYFTLDGARDMFYARPMNRSAISAHCAAKYAGADAKGLWIASSSSFASLRTTATNVRGCAGSDPTQHLWPDLKHCLSSPILNTASLARPYTQPVWVGCALPPMPSPWALVCRSLGVYSIRTATSQIVFSNGEYDPWRSGGVLADVSASVLAVEVGEGAHHLDLMFGNPADPPSVLRARQLEIGAIKRWVAEASGAES